MSGFIGYENLLKNGTVTASSETAGYEVEYAFDDKGYDWWQPSASGNATATLALTAGDNADYFGVSAHDLGDNGARCRLEYGDGTDWYPASDLLAPVSSESIVSRFVSVGQNLLKYSQELDNASWTKGASVTITADNTQAYDSYTTADKVDAVGASASANRVYQNVTIGHQIDGATYTASVYLKGVAGGESVTIRLSNDADGDGANLVCVLTTSWQRFEVSRSFSTSATGVRVSLSYQASAVSYYSWGAQLEESSAAGGHRVTFSKAYNPGPSDWRAVFYAKENLLTYSEQFDNAAWTKVNSSVTADNTTDPDGGTTADKIEATTTGSAYAYQSSLSVSAGDYVTASVYIKPGTSAQTQLYLRDITAATDWSSALFLITDGSPVYSSSSLGDVPIDYAVTDEGNGWYRISITTVAKASTAGLRFYVYAAVGTTTIGYYHYFWGAQVDRAPSVGPYQATTSAAVTNSIGSVGNISFGQRLDIPSGQTSGFSPGQYSPTDKILNSTSNGGVLLGRTVERTGQSFNVNFRNLDPSWVRSYWSDLYNHISIKPFFVSWDYDLFPLETSWAWTAGSITGPKYQDNLYMSFSLSLNAKE